MTPERLEMLRASLRKRDAMPDADLVLEAQPHDFEELFRLAHKGLAVGNGPMMICPKHPIMRDEACATCWQVERFTLSALERLADRKPSADRGETIKITHPEWAKEQP
jgi:hypothetical protein